MLSPSSSAFWFNSSSVPWATVPLTSSYPNSVVPITISANTGATRTGTITCNLMTLTITQLGSTFASANQAFTLFTSGSDSITGVTVNAAGDVYFTDTASPSLKKWTKSSNTISTLVNSILVSPRGIAVDASGTAYISDFGASAVWKWTSGGGLSVLANAGLYFPETVALNDYNGLVIGNNDSVKIATLPAGTLGNSLSGFTGSPAVAVDAQGDVYYATFNNPQITKRYRLAGTTTTFIFTGTSEIRGLAVDASGDAYITDVSTSSVRKRVVGSNTFSTLLSTGLSTPIGIALDSARTLYIADSGNHAVKTFPQAFVDTKKITIGLDPGSAPVAVVQPTTFDLVAPYVPTSDQSWLTVSPSTGGNVALSWTGTATARYAYLTVLGRQVLVQQGSPTNPQAATAPATNLAAISATLNGNVTSDGGGPVSERGIYWSTAIGFGINDPGVTKVPASTNGPGAYSVNITGLQPSSTYYFRAYVLTQAGGIGISQFDTFVTATATPATFDAPTATNFNALSGAITIGANITAAGNTPVTSRGVVFSATADNSNPQVGGNGCTSFTDAGTGIGAYSRVIGGLLPATQYAFRAWAVNLSGTTYSSIVTFTTPAPSYALATTSLLEGPLAGSSSVVLTVTPATAAWSATANDSWIHVITGNGNGSSVVSFSLDANTGSTRTGTLTIAGMTLTVTQAPAGYAAVNRVTQLGTALASQTGLWEVHLLAAQALRARARGSARGPRAPRRRGHPAGARAPRRAPGGSARWRDGPAPRRPARGGRTPRRGGPGGRRARCGAWRCRG